MKSVGFLTCSAVLFAGLAFGATYSFTPTTWADYGTLGNWKIGAAAATTLPGIADSLVGNQTFYFNDAANWAGTVRAEGNMALVNIADSTAYATAAFGQLDLQGDFPLRVGADGSDRLILGAGGFTGAGKLVVTGKDGYDFKAARKAVLIASVLKTAARLPACDADGWGLRLKDDPGDATRLNVWVSQTGLLIRVQ